MPGLHFGLRRHRERLPRSWSCLPRSGLSSRRRRRGRRARRQPRRRSRRPFRIPMGEEERPADVAPHRPSPDQDRADRVGGRGSRPPGPADEVRGRCPHCAPGDVERRTSHGLGTVAVHEVGASEAARQRWKGSRPQSSPIPVPSGGHSSRSRCSHVSQIRRPLGRSVCRIHNDPDWSRWPGRRVASSSDGDAATQHRPEEDASVAEPPKSSRRSAHGTRCVGNTYSSYQKGTPGHAR